MSRSLYIDGEPMIELTAFLAFVAAGIAIAIVPGPTTTVIMANSLRYGTRAGMLNVAGTQLGLASMLAVVVLGLQVIIAEMAGVFEIIRLIGAAYLVWLGIKLFRGGKFQLEDDAVPPRRGHSFFWQGFVVLWSNPKALLMFGALIPQFVSLDQNASVQTVLLGVTFIVVAAITDSIYAVLAGGAGRALTRTRIRMLERISGGLLIFGGVWLALSRR